MNDNYVYLHRSNETGNIFYIGEGRLNRAYVSVGRSAAWDKASAGGFSVEFILQNVSKQEAVEVEKNFISNPREEWELVNISPGRKVNDIDLQEVSEVVCIDPESPSGLRWKKYNNKSAGYFDGKYWSVRINKVLYAVHRVIWLLHTGSLDSTKVINHIDNDGSNNKIGNLEQVTQQVNSHRNRNNKVVTDVGVVFARLSTGYEYWIAYWYGIDSKRKSKSFNCKVLGYDEARQAAEEHRIRMLKEVNLQGGGYLIGDENV